MYNICINLNVNNSDNRLILSLLLTKLLLLYVQYLYHPHVNNNDNKGAIEVMLMHTYIHTYIHKHEMNADDVSNNGHVPKVELGYI